MNGQRDIIQCAFVENDLTDASYFATPCLFGKNGVEKVLPFGKLTAYEQRWLEKLLPDLKKQIQKGVEFVHYVTPNEGMRKKSNL